jgi:hypothetical protein
MHAITIKEKKATHSVMHVTDPWGDPEAENFRLRITKKQNEFMDMIFKPAYGPESGIMRLYRKAESYCISTGLEYNLKMSIYYDLFSHNKWRVVEVHFVHKEYTGVLHIDADGVCTREFRKNVA